MSLALRTQLGGAARLGAPAPARQQPRRAAALTVRAGELQPDQLQSALQTQLKRSAEKEAAAKAPAAEQPSQVPERRVEEAVQEDPAAAEATRQQSQAVQSELVQRLGVKEDPMQAALITQLKQSGTFDEAEPAAEAEPEPAASKLAPAALYEDGSLLFTADMLAAVTYEDVLAP